MMDSAFTGVKVIVFRRGQPVKMKKGYLLVAPGTKRGYPGIASSRRVAGV
ncbi:MAG: hypothetical protein LBD64_02195 [Odoribacteraceae bacterium]|nr:hypothetical protein [Odoribacteraceae bacterium]